MSSVYKISFLLLKAKTKVAQRVCYAEDHFLFRCLAGFVQIIVQELQECRPCAELWMLVVGSRYFFLIRKKAGRQYKKPEYNYRTGF